ncbi:helix-hairpin-helix domain-containing protein [Pontibacter qinzhouensis]|uniref:Helix-hairpin-helix domain-containing protein n=1 Tax=Pontibacter qinzhouensis TaxID=2603253 RepID=A0A5C8IU23_9BACT|nr:helix-hairpin-helix domain-containing protein [Pontibacter qinzhouensis]TXK24760.1 helix-hairpin-helix domain-containing protein [Pontibacter qinzhouensis]
MKKLRHLIRRHLGFSQAEVNGFLLLMSLLVLFMVLPFLYDAIIRPAPLAATAAREQQVLDSLVAQLELRSQIRKESQFKLPVVPLQPFNPNKLTTEQWQELGLPKFLAQRILNYRQKVGDFTYKAEVGRIYGLPDSVYQQLRPYIQLPEERPSRYNNRSRDIAAAPDRPSTAPHRDYPKREKFVLAPFNINTADTTQLKQIRGIGSKLSARIVKYRDGLGGFREMEQLQEVFGLSPEVVDSLQKYSYVQQGYTPKKLNINLATADELRAHTYISPNVARALVAYREQHGPYKQIDEIRKIKIISPELYEKLLPYLSL